MRLGRKNFTLAFVLNCLLALLLMVSFGSGWAILLMGVGESALHRYVSIVLVVAIAVHVALHHKSLTRRRRRGFVR